MTDPIDLAIALLPSAVIVVGGAMAFARLETIVKRNDVRLNKLESDSGSGNVSRADLLARITQVERNTEALTSLGDRVTRLETSTEIHHKDVTGALERLDRGQQQTHRLIGNFLAQAGGGKLMIMGPTSEG